MLAVRMLQTPAGTVAASWAEAGAGEEGALTLWPAWTGLPYVPARLDPGRRGLAQRPPGRWVEEAVARTAAGGSWAVSVYRWLAEGVYVHTAVWVAEGAVRGEVDQQHLALEEGRLEAYFLQPGWPSRRPRPLVDPASGVALALLPEADAADSRLRQGLAGAVRLILVPAAVYREAAPSWHDRMGQLAAATEAYVVSVNRAGAEEGRVFAGRSGVWDPTGKPILILSEHPEVATWVLPGTEGDGSDGH